MITKQQIEDILVRNDKLIEAITDFKTLVADNNLPITSDTNTLETALRSQLFQKLLAVDKGLKMRWDMLKTDEARIKLITDTINLDGYEQVNELQTALKAVERLYKQVFLSFSSIDKVIPFPLFADKWEMNLEAALNSVVFDWTGKEDVLTYIQSLAPALTSLREVFRSIMHTSYGLHESLALVSHFYTPESDKGAIEANEGAVMSLANDLIKHNALELLKK